ncbi:hypothetical protein SS50377_25531 [Spironucleus salmonicida]|uniref:Uncharacterized protein n=1 Tax=Spironucleus salmonicida TaxID=348837 RepID=V6LW90_9EUKA|nr:hypothetical protein SS50377_25531 [Spironucleus salmonicida]|eukprot:EST45079.1 Hypothetical protein SS50377_15099 [Spironucleus salmonicida]
MQIDFEHPVQSQVLLKYAPDNKHFHFQVTNGTILSLIFDRNGASDRQNVVVMKDQEFIGNTDNIICELISCNFVISSVLNAKHDVLLTVNSFQILTNNCNKIESTQVHHILNPERNYCSYFVNLHPQNYVVFNEIFEQSIWGMQKGNGFDIYRLVKNDDGLNFLTLSLCGLSIFLVIGGVGHALIKSIVDNVKVD